MRDELIQTGERESFLASKGRSSGVRQVESVMERSGWVVRFMDAWIWTYSLPEIGSAFSEDESGRDMIGLEVVVRRLSVTLMSEGL